MKGEGQGEGLGLTSYTQATKRTPDTADSPRISTYGTVAGYSEGGGGGRGKRGSGKWRKKVRFRQFIQHSL